MGGAVGAEVRRTSGGNMRMWVIKIASAAKAR
jgi:hypothetical protein